MQVRQQPQTLSYQKDVYDPFKEELQLRKHAAYFYFIIGGGLFLLIAGEVAVGIWLLVNGKLVATVPAFGTAPLSVLLYKVFENIGRVRR